MNFEKFTMWYFMMGLFTSFLGIYRYIRNKQNSDPDELTVLSWFLFWWVWLGWLIGRSGYLAVRNFKRKVRNAK